MTSKSLYHSGPPEVHKDLGCFCTCTLTCTRVLSLAPAVHPLVVIVVFMHFAWENVLFWTCTLKCTRALLCCTRIAAIGLGTRFLAFRLGKVHFWPQAMHRFETLSQYVGRHEQHCSMLPSLTDIFQYFIVCLLIK